MKEEDEVKPKQRTKANVTVRYGTYCSHSTATI